MKIRLLGGGGDCLSQPSPRDGFELSRLSAGDFEMSRLLAGDFKIRRLWELARDSNHLPPSPRWWGGVRSLRGRLYPAYEGLAWLQYAVSLEISIVARHCFHACPDLSPSGRRTVPTTAYLYSPGGTARQRENRRRRERPEDGPVGVGPLESAGPSYGPRTPLTRQDGEWR